MVGLLVFLVFIVLPLVELLLLVWIGTHIGFFRTVALVLVTGIIGALLVRVQGPRAWREILMAWRRGAVPGREMVAGALFLVGAAFLLTPGVLTDATGLLLMVPVVRRMLAGRVVGLFKRRALVHTDPETGGQVVRIRRLD